MSSLPRLPACRSCQRRKAKCDNNRPKCRPCFDNNNECMLVDGSSGQFISREHLYELERRMQSLCASNPGVRNENELAKQSDENEGTEPDRDNPSAISQGGGLSFMSSLFTDHEWRSQHSHIIRSLANVAMDAELNIEANKLPTSNETETIFREYLRISHVQHPFLLRKDILDLSKRVFRDHSDGDSTSRQHDMFRTFMILAIGSIHSYRRGTHTQNPMGYYVAAMQHFNPWLLRVGLTPIQDLLLLSRFALYHHIGISIWEIIRVCMRMCIEQGLHTKQKMARLAPLQAQLSRRVFWLTYMMDRYSSITLNRPFAISDNDIDVDLPADVDDEIFEAAQEPLADASSFRVEPRPGPSSEMTIALLSIKLRQILSGIHSEFARLVSSSSDCSRRRGSHLQATGQIHLVLERFMSELDEWRSLAPQFGAPGCLHEREDWFNLAHSRETFHLVRRAVDIAPKTDGVPSRSLLVWCQSSATRVISVYSDLFQRSLVTYTRSYFQMMFAAGLSLLYCGSNLQLKESSLADEHNQALSECQRTLSEMALDLPDARQYVKIFTALKKHFISKMGSSMERRDPPEQQASLLLRPTDMEAVGSYRWRSEVCNHDQFPSYQSSTDIFSAQNERVRSTSSTSPILGGPWPTSSMFEQENVFDQMMWNWDLLNDDSMWNVGQFAVGDLI